jgi:hypothetical protein
MERNGMSDIEGKVAREAMSECGQRASFNTFGVGRLLPDPSSYFRLSQIRATAEFFDRKLAVSGEGH